MLGPPRSQQEQPTGPIPGCRGVGDSRVREQEQTLWGWRGRACPDRTDQRRSASLACAPRLLAAAPAGAVGTASSGKGSRERQSPAPGGTLCPRAGGAPAAWLLGLGRGSSFPALASPGSLTFCLPGLAGTPATPQLWLPAVPPLSECEGPGSTGTATSAQGNVAQERFDPAALPSCRLSRAGLVPGCCHGLFLPQAAGKERGMLRSCRQPRLPPARRDEAVVRWRRMKRPCPGRVPSFPFLRTRC